MAKIKERRSAPRTPSALPLDLYDTDNKMVVAEGRCVNISEKGGLIESPKKLERESRLWLHLDSPGKSPLQVPGRIVWARKRSRSFAYGIEFQDPQG